MASSNGVIQNINVSDGGVPKHSISHAVVNELGIEGDAHSNTKSHGGPMRALCLFSSELQEALNAEGHTIAPGDLGENITISGLDWNTVTPGRRFQLGSVSIEITAYTAPCYKIAACFKDEDFTRIDQEKNPGWSRVYARIVDGGEFSLNENVVSIDLV
tara:strand:+ start:6726 stop:7202 length:477 start_codon:yes stop_codon:yes gene_type:complete